MSHLSCLANALNIKDRIHLICTFCITNTHPKTIWNPSLIRFLIKSSKLVNETSNRPNINFEFHDSLHWNVKNWLISAQLAPLKNPLLQHLVVVINCYATACERDPARREFASLNVFAHKSDECASARYLNPPRWIWPKTFGDFNVGGEPQ